MQAVDQAVEHMRGVELAVDELVAHGGPARLLAEHDADAVLLVEPVDRGHHDRRAVGQRDEADAHFALLGRVGAGRVHRGQRLHTAERGCGRGRRGLDEAPPWRARRGRLPGVGHVTAPGRWTRQTRTASRCRRADRAPTSDAVVRGCGHAFVADTKALADVVPSRPDAPKPLIRQADRRPLGPPRRTAVRQCTIARQPGHPMHQDPARRLRRRAFRTAATWRR